MKQHSDVWAQASKPVGDPDPRWHDDLHLDLAHCPLALLDLVYFQAYC